MAASWECPSLAMLNLPLKETGKTSFLGLKPLISAHYEENPDTFSDEIRQLDQLREHSTRPTRDYNGCSVLRRYFAQLHLLRARFPPETVGQIPVDFAWKDGYSGAEYIQEGFQIEQASVLYNIAALHSQLGSHGKRDSEQEMKEAVTHFQCSAGALSYLDEHFAINHASKDLSAEFVSLYNSLMLGQAQECLVEKSLKGIGRVKNITISRLATRVAEFYSRCCTLLEGGACSVIAKKNRDWPKLLKFKVFYYQSIAHYYQAAHAEEMGKYGELIALLQLTVQKLNGISGKPPKGMGDMMKMARQNFADHVTDKLAVARRQNEQVYHDSVPPVDTLELTSGADLVKPVSFHPTDPKNLGTDIFSRLIPMRAHEVASIFSEEKAKLMRSVMSSVEEKDEELQQYMRSLNATEVEKIHEDSPTIPDKVLRLHQSLQGRVEVVRRLHTSWQELLAMTRSVEEDFSAIREMKNKEEEEEGKFQSQFGARPISQMCGGMWEEMGNYYAYNLQALKSNVELKAMFNHHYPNLVLLTSPLASLKASLPKMTLLDTPAEEASESERWQQLLKEVEKMTKQRQALVGRFRQEMSSDDITRNLVGHLGNDQEVFLEDQMKQFKELANIIRQNLTAQENILTALTEANAKKATTRQTVQEIAQQQQAMFAGLIKSAGFLNLLQTKIQEGIVFYRKLNLSVSRLKKMSTEVCDSRSRERLNIERQAESAVSEVTSPTTPTSAPARPPKKAELAGKPLPPDQKGLLPLHPSSSPSGSGQEGAAPLNAHQQAPQQLDLQELQKVQIQQQQALLGGKKSPPPSEPPQLDNPNPTNVPTHRTETPPSQPLSPPAPQAAAFPPVPVPDATQTLNSLQVLLQPSSQPVAGVDPGVPGAEGSTASDPSLVPQRPPKPAHLKADLLPSPFPSLPPPTEEQSSQPSVLPSAEPRSTSLAGGPTDLVALQTGHDASTGSHVAVSHPNSSTDLSLPGADASSPHQPPRPASGEAPPPTYPPVVWATATTGGSGGEGASYSPRTASAPPHPLPAEGGTGAFPLYQLEPGQDPAVSQTQSPIPMSSPYYQPNINIQPGEVTVATSSIIGPIPSALAIPPATTSTTSTGPVPQGPIPDTQTLPALAASPPANARQQAPMTQPNLGHTFAPSGGSVTTTEGQPAVVTTGPAQPQYTLSRDENVGSHSVQTTEGDTAPGHPGTANDHREFPDSQPACSSASSAQVSPQIPQTGPSLQTVALPEIESQPQLHLPTTAADLPVTTTIGTTTAKPAGSVSNTATGTDLSSHSVVSTSDTNLAPTAPVSTQMSSFSVPVPSTALTGATMPPAVLTSVSMPPDVPTCASIPSVGVPSLPGVVPLQLTTLGSLATPLHLETPTDSTPVATELMLESLATQQQSAGTVQQIQQLTQSLEDQKKVIEAHRAENVKQEVAYQHQISQLQQQLHILQLKQEQEKATASDQQAALMKLLHQQQDMFSQQQSQMEKLNQQDESHRKEYLHVEEKFRESLRVEQEMKVSLQSQILQLTQENQKLNQALQTQAQQVQTLQLQLQQYSIHIQERDKQLVAFKDQHKEIVDKLEQRSQQRVAQLMQRVQDLQLQLNQRSRGDGGVPMLPQPLQPTVVQHQLANPQQNQDLGPTRLQQPNLPHPLQPSVPPPVRPPPHTQQSGGAQVSTSGPHHPTSAMQPPPQGPHVRQMAPPAADPRMTNPPLTRHPSSQQQAALQAPLVPMMPVHPQNLQRPVVPTSQPHSLMQTQQQQPAADGRFNHPQQAQMQPTSVEQMRPASLPSPQQGPFGPHMRPPAMPQSTPQTPSTPQVGGIGTLHPASHGSGNPPHPSRPVSHPSLQSHSPYPSIPTQQQQQQHLQPAPSSAFHSPSDPSLRPIAPQISQMMPHAAMTQQQPLPARPQVVMGPRFSPGQPVRPGMMVPGSQQALQPALVPAAGQPLYSHNLPHGPPPAAGLHQHHPQYRGHAP